MIIPFLQDTTFTGLISTSTHGSSQDWYSAFQSISGDLNLKNATIVPGESFSSSLSGLIVNVNGQNYKIPLLPI